MKTLLILSVVLCAALYIEAATVAPTEKENPAPKPEVNADTAVAADRKARAQFSFCLDGWHKYKGSCYNLFNSPLSWRSAENYCAQYESSLASAHNILEYNFLQQLVKIGGHKFAWIGGYYFEGVWRWEDGSQFNYYNWEATASTNKYQCLQLDSEPSKGWSNHGCSMLRPFVCQTNSNC